MSSDGNDLLTAFGGAMAVTATMTIIAIVIYYIWLFFNKKLHGFQSTLITILLGCEIGNIVSSIIQYGINLQGQDQLLCQIGLFLFVFFTTGTFMLSTLLVVSLLHLSTRLKRPAIVKLNVDFRTQVISVLLVVLLDFGWTCAMFFSNRSQACYLGTVGNTLYWTMFFLCCVTNISLLGFLLYDLQSMGKKLTKDKIYFRVILSVALVVGIIRIPQFLLVAITSESAQELFSDPSQYSLSIFTIFANMLSVLQGFFVVLVVGTNQGMFACFFRCCPGLTTTRGETSERSTEAKARSHRDSVHTAPDVQQEHLHVEDP